MKGEEAGAGRRVVLGVCTQKPRRKENWGEGEGERGEGGSKVEKQGASHLCPPVLHPCHHAMLLREEWMGVVVVCIHVHANAWQCHPRHLMPSSP